MRKVVVTVLVVVEKKEVVMASESDIGLCGDACVCSRDVACSKSTGFGDEKQFYILTEWVPGGR